MRLLSKGHLIDGFQVSWNRRLDRRDFWTLERARASYERFVSENYGNEPVVDEADEQMMDDDPPVRSQPDRDRCLPVKVGWRGRPWRTLPSHRHFLEAIVSGLYYWLYNRAQSEQHGVRVRCSRVHEAGDRESLDISFVSSMTGQLVEDSCGVVSVELACGPFNGLV